jgi:hypothetical protein
MLFSRVFVVLASLVMSVAPARAQSSLTTAQNLAAKLTAKRTVDLAAIAAAPSNKKFYVRSSGNDSNNGSSPSTAFRTIQRGINAVNNPGGVVIVGPGTYTEQLAFTSSTRSGTNGNTNTLFADTTGALTGDAAGAVLVSGTGGRAYGLTMLACNYWQFKWLTFQNQSTANAYIYPTSWNGTAAAASITFDACTFHVTPYYGVLAYYVGAFALTDCTFTRSAGSGYAAYLYTISGNALTVTGNSLNRTGSLYATSTFRQGSFTSYGGYSAYAYGLIAMCGSSTASTVTIQNNLVSDAYIGIYAYTYGRGHTLRVANNTSVYCYYGAYIYAYGSPTASITNNAFGNSYIGAYIYVPTATLQGHMEWDIVFAALSSYYSTYYNRYYRTVASSLGVLTTSTPSFTNPSTGDFTLAAGSAGIDGGYSTGAPATDMVGVLRPIDGNSDGTAAYDIGAFESSTTATLRVVRWREMSPDDE